MPEEFYIDTEDGSKKCRIITSLYSEKRKHHYLIYEYIDEPSENIFVSIYNPDSETDNELEDVLGEELEEVKVLLDDFVKDSDEDEI